MIKVGVIGKRGHAGRLISILRARPDVELTAVYTPHAPDAGESNLPFTQNFDDLLPCRAIVVASPSPTHAGYLDRLKKFPGYIFLEKPAVSTPEQTRRLKKWPAARKARVHVNFNLRFGPLQKILSKVAADPRLGTALAFDVHTSHGLAFTERYRNSWRSRKGASYGVLETVGVHYVNMALFLFGAVAESSASLRWVAGKSGPADFGVLHLRHKNGVLTTLRHSYAAPLLNQFSLIGTNGYWKYDGETARLYSPRETFDANGLFASPPLCEEWDLNSLDGDRASWVAALDYFLSVVARKARFPVKDFDLALESMTPIFFSSPRRKPGSRL